MLAYLIKRLLIFIPTLFVITVIVFFISLQAPGGPALIMLSQQSATGGKNEGINRQIVLEKRSELGLDKPIFYVSFSSLASYDKIHEIPFQRERDMLKNLSLTYGRADLVAEYYQQLILSPQNNVIHSLLGETNLQKTQKLIQELPQTEDYQKLSKAFHEIQTKQNPLNNYIPKINWNGFDNQYHDWLTNLFFGKLGSSYSDGKEVSQKVWTALKTTLSMTIVALILSILSSVILAVLSVYYSHSILPNVFNFIFFSLYSTPTFIVATFAIIVFGSSQYLDLFPVYGMGDFSTSMGLWDRVYETVSHFFLPVLCLSYLPTAFMYQQLYGNLKESMKKEYTMVAKSKGLPKIKIITKHALRNSLLPMISFLSNIFPAIIGGSFVVEFIFSLPGMGVLTMDAVFARDYPVVFANLLFISFAALVGALLSDLLLMVFDPRISLDKD